MSDKRDKRDSWDPTWFPPGKQSVERITRIAPTKGTPRVGLQKKLGQLAASLELLERKDRFLKAVVSELGQLLLETPCALCDGAETVASCNCANCGCAHARERLGVFAAGMQALLDEEAALVARFGGRPVLPLTRH